MTTLKLLRPKQKRLRTKKTSSTKKSNSRFFWRVDHANAAPSYLLGTCHMFPQSKNYIEQFRDKLELARVVYVEAIPSKIKMEADQFILKHKKSKVARLITVNELITKKITDRIGPMMEDCLLEMVKAKTIVRELDKHSFENMFLPLFKNCTKQKGFKLHLEELENQTETHVSLFINSLQPLWHSYVDGDHKFLETTTLPMQNDIITRNKQWLRSLVPSLRHGNVFVAAGAGHMVGIDNLLYLLRNKGFNVTRI